MTTKAATVSSPNEARAEAPPPGPTRHSTGEGLRFLHRAARKLSTASFWMSLSKVWNWNIVKKCIPQLTKRLNIPDGMQQWERFWAVAAACWSHLRSSWAECFPGCCWRTARCFPSWFRTDRRKPFRGTRHSWTEHAPSSSWCTPGLAFPWCCSAGMSYLRCWPMHRHALCCRSTRSVHDGTRKVFPNPGSGSWICRTERTSSRRCPEIASPSDRAARWWTWHCPGTEIRNIRRPVPVDCGK